MEDSISLAMKARRAIEALKPLRRGGIEKILKSTPSGRPRTSGPVGPEIDWSIRLAKIYHRSKGFDGPSTIPLIHSFAGFTDWKVREKVAIHSHVQTLDLSDEGVRRWTAFAMKEGLHYDGEFAYKFPGKKSKDRLAKVAFDHFKALGLVPTGKRSSESARRRREARSTRAGLARARKSAPLEVPKPLVWRASISAASLRRGWVRSRGASGLSWSAYRSTCVVVPVLCLWPSGHRTPVSEPVKLALDKIYSVVEYHPKGEVTYGNEFRKEQTTFRWRVREPDDAPSIPFKEGVKGKAFAIHVDGEQPIIRFLGGQSSMLKTPG